MPLDTNLKQLQEKSVKLIEQKKVDKVIPYKLNEEVTYFAKGEEPKVGNIVNMTEWKGDKIFQVAFSDGSRSRWGSDRQIKRTKSAWDKLKEEKQAGE